jgi:hypothetical protein
VRLKFELIRGEGAKTHWRCVFYKKEHTLGLRVMAHFLGKASGGKGHKEIGLFVGGRHFQAGGVVGPFSRFCVSVRGDVFSFRRPGFLSKTLVYMKSFNVQRGGVRSQRSHDHVHVLLNPGNRRFARPLHTLRVPARVCRSTTTTRLCLFRILLLPSHQL